jgi:hypothetical protein
VHTQASVRDKKWGQANGQEREFALSHLETELRLIKQDKD